MFEDLFSPDTWDTIQRGMGTAGSAFNTVAPIINRGAQLAAGVEGTRRAGQLAAARGQAQQTLDQMFTPGGEYAQELRKQLERRDAAAGRRSQYGTRETELMAKLAQQKASVLTNPQYAAYLTGAQQSPYGPLAGAVGSLTGGQQQGGIKVPNTPPGTSEGLKYLYNSMFAPASEASIASGIGGAGSALGATGLGDVGALGAEGVSGLSGLLPGYAEAGGPQASGIFTNAGGALTGAGGDLAAAGLGGAGSALSGMGAGSLAGTVGATDALGALAGGTGFLPAYTGTAGATGLFGGGGGAAGGYGAGTAGAAGGAGAGGGAAGGVGASGFALPALTALPFLAALYGFGSGILGKGDQGNPFTQSQEAMAQNLFNQNKQGNINTLEDLNKFGGGNVQQYAQQQGLDTSDMQSYDKIRQQLQQQSGGGTFLGNFLSGNLMDNGGG